MNTNMVVVSAREVFGSERPKILYSIELKPGEIVDAVHVHGDGTTSLPQGCSQQPRLIHQPTVLARRQAGLQTLLPIGSRTWVRYVGATGIERRRLQRRHYEVTKRKKQKTTNGAVDCSGQKGNERKGAKRKKEQDLKTAIRQLDREAEVVVDFGDVLETEKVVDSCDGESVPSHEASYPVLFVHSNVFHSMGTDEQCQFLKDAVANKRVSMVWVDKQRKQPIRAAKLKQFGKEAKSLMEEALDGFDSENDDEWIDTEEATSKARSRKSKKGEQNSAPRKSRPKSIAAHYLDKEFGVDSESIQPEESSGSEKGLRCCSDNSTMSLMVVVAKEGKKDVDLTQDLIGSVEKVILTERNVRQVSAHPHLDSRYHGLVLTSSAVEKLAGDGDNGVEVKLLRKEKNHLFNPRFRDEPIVLNCLESEEDERLHVLTVDVLHELFRCTEEKQIKPTFDAKRGVMTVRFQFSGRRGDLWTEVNGMRLPAHNLDEYPDSLLKTLGPLIDCKYSLIKNKGYGSDHTLEASQFMPLNEERAALTKDFRRRIGMTMNCLCEAIQINLSGKQFKQSVKFHLDQLNDKNVACPHTVTANDTISIHGTSDKETSLVRSMRRCGIMGLEQAHTQVQTISYSRAIMATMSDVLEKGDQQFREGDMLTDKEAGMLEVLTDTGDRMDVDRFVPSAIGETLRSMISGDCAGGVQENNGLHAFSSEKRTNLEMAEGLFYAERMEGKTRQVFTSLAVELCGWVMVFLSNCKERGGATKQDAADFMLFFGKEACGPGEMPVFTNTFLRSQHPDVVQLRTLVSTGELRLFVALQRLAILTGDVRMNAKTKVLQKALKVGCRSRYVRSGVLLLESCGGDEVKMLNLIDRLYCTIQECCPFDWDNQPNQNSPKTVPVAYKEVEQWWDCREYCFEKMFAKCMKLCEKTGLQFMGLYNLMQFLAGFRVINPIYGTMAAVKMHFTTSAAAAAMREQSGTPHEYLRDLMHRLRKHKFLAAVTPVWVENSLCIDNRRVQRYDLYLFNELQQLQVLTKFINYRKTKFSVCHLINGKWVEAKNLFIWTPRGLFQLANCHGGVWPIGGEVVK